jgi:transposase-like protein
LPEALHWYPKASMANLEQLRWKAGFRCPRCEGDKGWRLADGRWSCAGCSRRISVTAGTVFDRSRIPLQDWFTAAWYMTNQKHGLSALGLQHLLGLGSYQTAWTMLQRLRDVSANSLIAFIGDAVESGAEVYTDAWAGYSALARQGYRHKPINLSYSGDPAHVSMPGVHVVASLLKRWLLGTHQGSVTAQHLDAYLDEFTFRFNRRHSRQRGILFYRLLENAVVTGPTRFRPTRALDSNHNR